ncbi:MAG TPA: hypothetical protein VK846_07650 [Candidatus Limnocylindria bacterium]|nr:hypothetical protein [Candidatus Limnocylindria bacterium]
MQIHILKPGIYRAATGANSNLDDNSRVAARGEENAIIHHCWI